jgi:hypothetical protein
VLIDFITLALGLYAVTFRKRLARTHLKFQKDVLKLRNADDPRTIRSSERVALLVGGSAIVWALARLAGWIDQ